MAAQVEYLKWIPQTDFMVDGFRFQNPRCKHYFLTHYHSDHTTGLYSSFAAGLIFCSPITASLLIRKSRMPPGLIRALEMNTRHVISGVGVTLLDANHCPGAAMILFEVPRKLASLQSGSDGSSSQQEALRVLHVGDFRWRSAMGEDKALKGRPLDVLFLDTTYANPRHEHPPQDFCIAQIAELCLKHTAKEPATAFVIGAYGIGKERAFLGAARTLGWRVWVEPGKAATLKLLHLSAEDTAVLSEDKEEAKIHVTFMGRELQPERLEARRITLGVSAIVGFRPTGWSFQKSGKVQERSDYAGAVTLYGIPYSEHSSFPELRACVATLRPRRIIPTVNVTDDPATTRRIVDMFSDLTDNSRNKGRLDRYFALKPSPQPASSPPSCRQPPLSLLPHCGTALPPPPISSGATVRAPPDEDKACSPAARIGSHQAMPPCSTPIMQPASFRGVHSSDTAGRDRVCADISATVALSDIPVSHFENPILIASPFCQLDVKAAGDRLAESPGPPIAAGGCSGADGVIQDDAVSSSRPRVSLQQHHHAGCLLPPSSSCTEAASEHDSAPVCDVGASGECESAHRSSAAHPSAPHLSGAQVAACTPTCLPRGTAAVVCESSAGDRWHADEVDDEWSDGFSEGSPLRTCGSDALLSDSLSGVCDNQHVANQYVARLQRCHPQQQPGSKAVAVAAVMGCTLAAPSQDPLLLPVCDPSSKQEVHSQGLVTSAVSESKAPHTQSPRSTRRPGRMLMPAVGQNGSSEHRCETDPPRCQTGCQTDDDRDDVAASLLDCVNLQEQQFIMEMIQLRHHRQQQQQHSGCVVPTITTTSCKTGSVVDNAGRKRQQSIAAFFTQKAAKLK